MSSAKEIIRGKLLRFGLRYINYLEPFAKYGISFYLNGELKNRYQQGAVYAYKVKTRRLSRWHYKIEVSLDLNPRQAISLLADLQRLIRAEVEVM